MHAATQSQTTTKASVWVHLTAPEFTITTSSTTLGKRCLLIVQTFGMTAILLVATTGTTTFLQHYVSTANDTYSGPFQNETGSDGIGDTAYVIDANNSDTYPLIGPINFFNAGTWNETTHYVHTVSNSTVSDIYFSEDDKLVSFNITGSDATTGFCRVAVPKELLWSDPPEDWTVLVNNTAVPHSAVENGDHTYLYFTYNHSNQNVQIIGTRVIPEFPSATFLLLFMIFTLVAVIFWKKARKKRLTGTLSLKKE